MNAAAHIAIGAGSGWALLWLLDSSGTEIDAPVLIAGGLVAGVGALVPDIDHRGSTVSRRVPRRLMRASRRLVAPIIVLAALVAVTAGTAHARGLLSTGRPLFEIAALLLVPAAILVVASLLVSRLFGHRGATHSLVFAAAGAIVAAAVCERLGLTWWFGALFGVGWLSHIAADALTRRGVPSLLWPFAGRR